MTYRLITIQSNKRSTSLQLPNCNHCMQSQQHTYVIQLDIPKASSKQDLEIIYNVLFARRFINEAPSIRKLLNNLALSTRLKRTFTDTNSEDPTDDSNEQVLLFFKFDHVELPRL